MKRTEVQKRNSYVRSHYCMKTNMAKRKPFTARGNKMGAKRKRRGKKMREEE